MATKKPAKRMAEAEHPKEDRVPSPSHQHAFIIAGTNTLFLCHMTNSWMAGHEFQVVLRVDFPDHVRQTYLDDRRAHPKDWYILGNVADDLMRQTDLQRRMRRSFIGSIWRGWPDPVASGHWPWADARPVVADFEVTIERVVHFRHFDFGLVQPPTLTYLLFGAGDEAHLHHYQVKSPEFDQVVTLSRSPKWLPLDLLESGVPVTFPDLPAVPEEGDVYCSNPLKDGTHYVHFAGRGPRRQITIDRTVWFSTFPVNEKDPCAEGRREKSRRAKTSRSKKRPSR